MSRCPRILGVAIGVIFAVAIVFFGGARRSAQSDTCAMISECDGPLREIVIQYTSGADSVLPVYREFLPLLAGDVTVDVVCADQDSWKELHSALQLLKCKLRPMIAGHPMTAWSRDRWVALLGDRTTLLAPLGENAADSWPQRAGDERVAFDIAQALSPSVSAHRSNLLFDAGDLLCDQGNVFVTRAVLDRNLNRTVATRDELVATLRVELHRRVILLDDSPDHHAGMYMMAAADHTMLVADPRLAQKCVADLSMLLCAGRPSSAPGLSQIVSTLPGGPDFSEETQRKLDRIAATCAAEGYHVVRIPTLPAMDRKTYLTYVNVITEIRDGKRIVYMPIFRGAEALNHAAAQIWSDLGYVVKPVDCTTTYRCFGNLHCLVNVLSREGGDRRS